MESFELWSYDVQGDLGEYAEHTYLRCPGRNQYFNCWGNHESPTQGSGVHRFSADGIYEVADVYRKDVLGAKDTAGLGVYGVNGVCHQTANLFLYSSGKATTIADGVKGYAATCFAYGLYGTFGPLGAPLDELFLTLWKATVYTPSYNAYLQHTRPPRTLFDALKLLHESIEKKGIAPHPHEVIHQEVALLAKHAVPGLDTNLFRDLHLAFLGEKIKLLATGITGLNLVDQINDLASQFQKSLATRIGAESYEKLMGQKPGDAIKIIDPQIAAAVSAA